MALVPLIVRKTSVYFSYISSLYSVVHGSHIIEIRLLSIYDLFLGLYTCMLLVYPFSHRIGPYALNF